jgi:hypothetical protein
VIDIDSAAYDCEVDVSEKHCFSKLSTFKLWCSSLPNNNLSQQKHGMYLSCCSYLRLIFGYDDLTVVNIDVRLGSNQKLQ